MQYLNLRDCAGGTLLQVTEEPVADALYWTLNSSSKRNFVHLKLHKLLIDAHGYGDMFKTGAFYNIPVDHTTLMLDKELDGWIPSFEPSVDLVGSLKLSNVVAMKTLLLICSILWYGIKFLALMITIPFAIMFFKNRE